MAFDTTNFLEVDADVEDDFRFTDRAGTVESAGSGLYSNNTAGKWCLGNGSTVSSGTGPSANPAGRSGHVYTESSTPVASTVWAMKRNISFDSTIQDVFLDLKYSRDIAGPSEFYIEYATNASPNETTDWSILETIPDNDGTPDWVDDTFSFSGISTTTLWIRIRYNSDNGFDNDLAFSTWREYSVDTANITPSEFDYDNSDIDIEGTGFEDVQSGGTVYISDVSTLSGGTAEVDIGNAINTWTGTSINLNLSSLNSTDDSNLDTLGPGARYVIVVNNSGDEFPFAVTTHRIKAFGLAASGNIAASGANTTVQLTAPATKTTGDFGGGRIQDDENPTDTVDLAIDEYREDEWCIEAVAGAVAEETYNFRILVNGVVVDTYSVTPQITINASGGRRVIYVIT